MFPIPRSPNKSRSSRKSLANTFNDRARKAHEKWRALSEADLSKINGYSITLKNVPYENSLAIHQNINQRNLSVSCSHRLDDVTLDPAKSPIVLDGLKIDEVGSSRKSSITDTHSLQSIEEDSPLKCISESLRASNRKLSKVIFHRPKKWASSVIKGSPNMKRKSVSESDFIKFHKDLYNSYTPLSSIKIRSLERGRNLSPTGVQLGIYSDSYASHHGKRRWSIAPCADSFSGGSKVNLCEKTTYARLQSTELQKMRDELSNCKRDINELRSKLQDFKEEVHIGISKLHTQIKVDEERYSKLCNKINHITDLHQAQMRYFQTLIQNSDNERNKSIDSFVFDILNDKLNSFEGRISKLEI